MIFNIGPAVSIAGRWQPAAAMKSPAFSRGFSADPLAGYLLRPEPGPVGANVDPLGEALGARVFPDGFILVLPFGEMVPLVEDPVPMPTVPPAPVPLIDEPVAALPAAPEAEPPVEPLLCAKATVLDSARAPASAIVVSFMKVSFGLTARQQLAMELRCSSIPCSIVPPLKAFAVPTGKDAAVATKSGWP